MARHILVVTTAPVDGEALRDRVLEHTGDDEPEVKVVATASDLSPLDWLANDEDDARAEAGARAMVGRAVAPEADRVEAEVGDTDLVQAIEDARAFPADELVLVTRKEDDARWLRKAPPTRPSRASTSPSGTWSSTRLTARAASTVVPTRGVSSPVGERRLGKPEVTGSISVRSIGKALEIGLNC